MNIGASFGWHAIGAAAVGCDVIAFEPFPPSFELLQVAAVTPRVPPSASHTCNPILQRNIAANGFGGRVLAVQAAASTRATSSSLIVHDKSNNFGYAVLHKVGHAFNALSFLKLCFARPLLRWHRQTNQQVGLLHVVCSSPPYSHSVYRVAVDTIDSALVDVWEERQPVNVAVLDCEGHELHALCGAMKLLMRVSGTAAAYGGMRRLCNACSRATVCSSFSLNSPPTLCTGYVVIIFSLQSAALTLLPQYTRHEQPRNSHVHLVMRYEYAPHFRARFSFLSALGYSLSVLDEEDGSMRPFSANDAAAFNNKSR